MKKLVFSLILIFLCYLVQAQSKNIKGRISSSDTADLSVLNIYPFTFPDVSVVFRAETRTGEPVWNLTKEKMRVTEDGSSCDVLSLSQLSSNKPIVLGIVVDHSSSMSVGYTVTETTKDGETIRSEAQFNSPIDSAKKAVKNFVKSFDAAKDFMSVIGFGERIDTKLPATQDIKKINAVVDAMQPVGSTALYDAIIAGMDELKNADGIKVLIVLTDGQDNVSKATWKDVTAKAIHENIPIYIVGLGEVEKDTLQQIAKQAKGKCYFTESSSSLDKIYAEISKQVQAFYDLVYRSENFSSADTLRNIELRFDIDSVFLVTSPAEAHFPEEVVAAVAAKERTREFLLYGGIGIIALAGAGFLLYRYSRKNNVNRVNSAPVISKVFPNPARGPLTIRVEGKATQLKVFNMNGQTVSLFAITDGEFHFDLSSLPRGAYILTAFYGASQSNGVHLVLE